MDPNRERSRSPRQQSRSRLPIAENPQRSDPAPIGATITPRHAMRDFVCVVCGWFIRELVYCVAFVNWDRNYVHDINVDMDDFVVTAYTFIPVL